MKEETAKLEAFNQETREYEVREVNWSTEVEMGVETHSPEWGAKTIKELAEHFETKTLQETIEVLEAYDFGCGFAEA